MNKTTGGPPRLVELLSIPLKKPAIPEKNLSLAKTLLKPITIGMAQKTVIPPMRVFKFCGEIMVIIHVPIGIPKALPINIGISFLNFTLLNEYNRIARLLNRLRKRLMTTTFVGSRIRIKTGASTSASPNPVKPLMNPANSTAHVAISHGNVNISMS